jgi:hypothetical protein
MTTINAGFIVVGTDTAIPLASQVVFNGGGLAFWNAVPAQPAYRYVVPSAAPVPAMTTSRDYLFNGNGTFDIGAGLTFTQAATSIFSGQGISQKSGMGTMVLNGLKPGCGHHGPWWGAECQRRRPAGGYCGQRGDHVEQFERIRARGIAGHEFLRHSAGSYP